jgi:hypothetical protein
VLFFMPFRCSLAIENALKPSFVFCCCWYSCRSSLTGAICPQARCPIHSRCCATVILVAQGRFCFLRHRVVPAARMRVLAPFVFLAESVIRYILARRFIIIIDLSISEKGAKIHLFLRRLDVRNHNSCCGLHCWVGGWNCNNTVEVLR